MKCRVLSQHKTDLYRKRKVNEMSKVTVAAMLGVCELKLHFGEEKMKKAAKEIERGYESLTEKYVTFEDLKECLAETDGVVIPFSFDPQKSETLDDQIRIAEYTQKAFACAVLCTVLCDKFLFGQKKAQQAVKQLCDMFDEFYKSKNTLSQYLKELYIKYYIQVS